MKACVQCGSLAVADDWRCADCGFRPDRRGRALSFVMAEDAISVGFEPELFEKLSRVEQGNFWFLSRNRLITWAARRYFPDVTDVLEVGCGTGFVLSALSHALPNARITGSEVLADGLEVAASRVPRAMLYQIDARRIPFRSHFDLAGAFDVLEHIDEDEAALEQIGAALTPRGGLLLTVPQHPALWSHQDELAHHRRRYTAAGLRQRLSRAGFDVIRMTSFVSLLLPAMFAQRLASRARPADAVEGLQAPAPLRTALSSVMRAEFALIARGVSFPVGGSLLVVARRNGKAAP